MQSSWVLALNLMKKEDNKCICGKWFIQGVDVWPSLGPSTLLCVFTGRLCDRWAQQAQAAYLQLPRSPLDVTIWAFISRSPSQGGSLGFDVPAAVEKLKFVLRDPLGGWVGGVGALQ